MMHFFGPQKFTFSSQPIFYPRFLNEEDRIWKTRLSKLHCRINIDFDDIQVWSRPFSLSLNACKVMRAFLIFSGQILKKTIVTLQALRLKLNSLNQTCTSSKSIMQLAKTSFSDSVIFIEKKRVENRLWAKSEFLWAKNYNSCWPVLFYCSRDHWKLTNHRINQKQSNCPCVHAWLSCLDLKSGCSAKKSILGTAKHHLHPSPPSSPQLLRHWHHHSLPREHAPHVRGHWHSCTTPQAYARGRRRSPRLGSNLPKHD